MNDLHQIVDDYLTVRRSLGYKLESAERILRDFAVFVAQAGSSFVTTGLALAWATSRATVSARTAAYRIGTIRGFAAFAHTIDPRTEIPPSQCLPYRSRRPLPYLFSNADLEALMQASQRLHAPTFCRCRSSTLFGLLAATGMRVGEAIALDRDDFDRDEGVLTIRAGKFGKSREVPLHLTTVEALREYEGERERTVPHPKSPAFFVSAKGTRLFHQNVDVTFRRLLRRAGLLDTKPRRPRIHDLRHFFAVQTVCDWYRAGLDVEAQLPLLSTYLGHVSPSSTYWYLTASPELVSLAAQRLETSLGDLP